MLCCQKHDPQPFPTWKKIIIFVNCWRPHGVELKINSSIDDRLSAHFIWLLFLGESEASFIFIFCFSSIGGTYAKKKRSRYFLDRIRILSVKSPKFPVVEDLLQLLCMHLDISDLVDIPPITSAKNDCLVCFISSNWYQRRRIQWKFPNVAKFQKRDQTNSFKKKSFQFFLPTTSCLTY